MDQDKVLISKYRGMYFARYKDTNLRGCGESIEEAMWDLEDIIKRLKTQDKGGNNLKISSLRTDFGI